LAFVASHISVRAPVFLSAHYRLFFGGKAYSKICFLCLFSALRALIWFGFFNTPLLLANTSVFKKGSLVFAKLLSVKGMYGP
jgi:hypothetical protein